MLDRLQIVKQRFDEISDLIIQPDVISDQALCAIESRV
jgi:peptide chain release factor 1